MGIYIEGIKMPKNETYLRIDEKGEVYVYGSYPTELYKAIPVQPHGRCIDADNLLTDKSISTIGNGMTFGGQYSFSESEIINAPTIIPADRM